MRGPKPFYFYFTLIIQPAISNGQQPIPDSSRYRTIVADARFLARSQAYQRRWGTNRRKEWATPVYVPVLWLDTAMGGLKPYEAGGGNETKSFRLRNNRGKEYTLRSINKSRDDVVPTDFDETFVETIIKDGISSSHPYGAFAITNMQEKAGILHAVPLLVYLPHQAALDSFDKKYGGDLYLFEQRPDGNWSDAPNFGNAKDFSSTEKLIERILDDNRNRARQFSFVKARLFDMLIGDWDRHEDNFRWARFDSAGKRYYEPVPRDRDQSFYTHNGKLLDKVLPIAGFSFMQHFDHTMGNMISFNSEERDFDRFFTNEMGLHDWLNAASDLQHALTDEVISQSVRQLPPEIFAVSGAELIEKLISRCGQLKTIAESYYLFLAKEVDITGSKQKEYFEVSQIGTNQTKVAIHRIDNKGQKESIPYYNRVFDPVQTSELRIYGIGNMDIYNVNAGPGITVRIIGGADRDSVIQSGNRVHIYDNRDNYFKTSSARTHLSGDSSIHAFKYEYYQDDTKGFMPVISYNYEDRAYVGLNFTSKTHKWRREPFASRHSLGLNYSISQNAVSAYYKILYPNTIGRFDLFIEANYDAIRWTNFYGFGNNTVSITDNCKYYRLRSQEFLGSIGIRKEIGKSRIELAPYYERIDTRIATNEFASTLGPVVYPKLLDPNDYIGFRMILSHASVDDPIVPTKGIVLWSRALVSRNLTERFFFHHVGVKVQGFLKLSNKFSLSVKAGFMTSNSSAALTPAIPRLNQYAVLGGPESLRGFRFERFWGKKSFYNNNELRFITNIRSYLLNAKLGILAFFDDGRVWMPPDFSNKLHTSYGGAVMLAPFNQLCFTFTYGVSNEMTLVQFKLNSLF